MFQDHSKIPDASAVDQFKKFSIIAITTSVFGLVLLHYVGAIAIACMIRTMLLSKHDATKQLKDRTRYVVLAGIGGLLGAVGVLLSMTT